MRDWRGWWVFPARDRALPVVIRQSGLDSLRDDFLASLG